MSIEKLLTHRCDIYHLDKNETAKGTYGVPIKDFQPEHTYPQSPDEEDVKSYFAESSQSIIQKEPDNKVTEIMKSTFLIGTDIRLNDKVVFNGVSYKAQLPRRIKNSHIEVKVIRNDSL